MRYTAENLQIDSFQATHDEYAAWLRINNTVWQDKPVTLSQLQYEDRVWPPEFFAQRRMIKAAGSVVATAYLRENHWQYQPGKYDVDILVHPDYQNRGIGSTVYNAVLRELANRNPIATSIVSSTREDAPHAVAFLQNRGFAVCMRWARSRLYLNECDAGRFAEAIPHVEGQGIQIYSIRELAAVEPAWQRKWYEMDRIAGEDAPSPDPMSPASFEKFVQNTIDPPQFMRDGTFVAVDAEGQWLASTELADNGNKKHLTTPFTCVHPDYRRRGIATALKVRAIQFAQNYGAETITTGNEIANPMYQINLALGFKPLPHRLTMKKSMEG